MIYIYQAALGENDRLYDLLMRIVVVSQTNFDDVYKHRHVLSSVSCCQTEKAQIHNLVKAVLFDSFCYLYVQISFNEVPSNTCSFMPSLSELSDIMLI